MNTTVKHDITRAKKLKYSDKSTILGKKLKT